MNNFNSMPQGLVDELNSPAGEPKSPQSTWMLVGQESLDQPPRRLKISTQPYTVGRHPDSNACLADATVSSNHAELLTAGDKLLVRDLGSTNGTLLNGRRVQTVEPLRSGDILHFGGLMFTVHPGQQQLESDTLAVDVGGEAIAQVHFDTLISRPGIIPAFQPIIDLKSRTRLGYEVLSRSQLMGLETPAQMFKVAAQRTSEAALSRVCRLEGMRRSLELDGDLQFYLNTHPAELQGNDLFESLQVLKSLYPKQRIMLEVHESGVTSVDFLRSLRSLLADLDFGLAYDDFGSGQARLEELIEVPPDVLKFDVKLVQGLPTATPARRSTIEGLIRIVKDLGVVTLAEGIETDEEASICEELGFELAQGYLFGRGEKAEKWINEG